MAQQVSLGVEFHDGGRGLAAFVLGRIFRRALLVVEQRRGTVDDPDVIVGADRNPGDLAEDPVFRQRLRPERLGLETRARFGLGGLLRNGRTGEHGQRHENDRKSGSHGRLPVRRLFRR
jgi:hypothetical protein